MTDCILSIDDFQFADFEVPERIRFGGDQAVVVHKPPGGTKIIDTMGRDDAPLSWSGMFLGPLALQRARYLDYLRAEGKQHTLTWHQLRYSVVIRTFTADFERYYKLPYTITLEVVSDLAQPVSSFPSASVTEQMADDSQTAKGLGGLLGDDTLNGLLATLDSAISTVSDFASATTAAINSVVVPLQAVQQRVNVLLGSVSNTLQNIGSVGGLAPSNPVAARLAKVNAEISGAVQTPTLVQLASVTGRMGLNLSLVSGPVNSHKTAVGATSLYRVAADEYGDATQWPVIAKANGLTDPDISGVTTLSIPNQPGTSTGGVLQ